MSWINSNATYKQNSKNDLSFYHGFSKTPVEPTSTGTAATTLANASTKGGHTVIGTEVWAEEIPWFGLVPSRAVAVTRLSGLTKLNDLVKVDGEGGKVYKYIGADDATFTEAQWSSFWQEVTLTNGMTLNNRHNQPVLRYYLNQPMQTLTTTNNASIDSKGYATRLFVNESNHTGLTSGGSVVSQFAAGTDNIKNGIPSVELNPKLYLGTTEKIAGTHYYDYNVSGTILWSTAVTSSSPKISCFRYIGKTVTGQLSTVDSTVKSHALDIADIKLALGMNPNPDSPTTSVTARVETVEDVVRVLLGLGDSDAIVATESISTTANTAATTAISGALEEGGSINTAIKNAIDAIPEVQAATTSVAGVVTISDNNAIATTETSTAAATVAAVAATRAAIETIAGNAQSAAEEAASAAQAAQAAAQNAQSAVEGAANNASASATAAAQSASAAAQSATSASNAETAAKNAQTAAQGSATSATQSASAAQTAQQQATASAQSAAQAAADAKAAKDFVEALTIPDVTTTNSTEQLDIDGHTIEVITSTFTAQTDTTSTSIGTMTANENGLATGATVVAVANDALRAAKAYSNSLHTTSVSYHVTDTLPTVPAGKEEEYKGRIYLVLTGIDGVTAAAGDRIEYMYVQENGVWGWEQIGTTTADLAEYAKTADLNATNVGSGAVKVSQTNGVVSSVTVATEALVNNGAIKTSVADANALVKAGDALAAIKLAKPESYIKSINAEKSTGWNNNNSSGEVNLEFTHFGGWDGTEMFWDRDTNKVGPSYYYAGKLPSYNIHPAAVINNTIIYKDNSSGEFGFTYSSFIASDAYDTVDKDKFINTNKIIYFNGASIFANNPNLKIFKSNLDNAMNASRAFYGTSLSEFIVDMPSLEVAEEMFSCYPGDMDYPATLKTFIGDLSNLKFGTGMFNGQKLLTTFIGDLGSLVSGYNMFSGCSLNTESVECIADTINGGSSVTSIDIDIANESPSDREIMAFNTIHDKGWNLYVKGSSYTPTEPSAITTTDENGEVRTTPIPFYAKAVEVSEENAEYVDNAGKFYRVLGGQYIYVNDPETYGMFTCLEDAVANMRLTKYVKPEVEA